MPIKEKNKVFNTSHIEFQGSRKESIKGLMILMRLIKKRKKRFCLQITPKISGKNVNKRFHTFSDVLETAYISNNYP